MDRFNARGRAKNFSKEQFVLALSYAHAHKVKVYLTLNTLIKNNELYELFISLHSLRRPIPMLVIVQDWGVY